MNRSPIKQAAGRITRDDLQALGIAGQNRFQENDVLLAFKHIGLSDLLNSSDKQFAAFLVNSYNRKTGRCDPSLHTASVLLRISERTIIRAIEKLVSLEFFGKRRHGGHNHCNSYQPNWPLFRALEQDFRARQRAHSKRFAAQELSASDCHSSPPTCHPCHGQDDKAVTQTFPSNNIPGTYNQITSPPAGSPENGPNQQVALGSQGWPSRGGVAGSTSRGLELQSERSPQSSHESSQTAALRNWNNDLMQLRSHTGFAQIIDAIDAGLQDAATKAELKRRGGGLEHILDELARRGDPGGGQKSGA